MTSSHVQDNYSNHCPCGTPLPDGAKWCEPCREERLTRFIERHEVDLDSEAVQRGHRERVLNGRWR